jgi:thioesterase domain-containing protein
MMGDRPDRFADQPLAAETSLHLARCEKDETPAVFLLPGLSGILQELATLISPIDAPVQFVPIRYRHWSELRPDPDELDRLVADCVRQIESHGPPATILLAGYSFGGNIAWAVARAMATSGHRISLLGLIDSPANPYIEASAKSTVGRFGRLVRGIRRGETGQQLARSSAGILFRSRTWMRTAFKQLHGFGLLPRMFNSIDANIQMRYHIILLRECVARMAASGERCPYPSVLFRCSDRPFGEAADLGWTHYLPNLRVVTLSGDHSSVMQTQNVEQIIAELNATILDGE